MACCVMICTSWLEEEAIPSWECGSVKSRWRWSDSCVDAWAGTLQGLSSVVVTLRWIKRLSGGVVGSMGGMGEASGVGSMEGTDGVGMFGACESMGKSMI